MNKKNQTSDILIKLLSEVNYAKKQKNINIGLIIQKIKQDYPDAESIMLINLIKVLLKSN